MTDTHSVVIPIDFNIQNYIRVAKMIANAPDHIFSQKEKEQASRIIHEMYADSDGNVKCFGSPVKEIIIDNADFEKHRYISEHLEGMVIISYDKSGFSHPMG